jgi:hypothetical protein
MSGLDEPLVMLLAAGDCSLFNVGGLVKEKVCGCGGDLGILSPSPVYARSCFLFLNVGRGRGMIGWRVDDEIKKKGLKHTPKRNKNVGRLDTNYYWILDFFFLLRVTKSPMQEGFVAHRRKAWRKRQERRNERDEKKGSESEREKKVMSMEN